MFSISSKITDDFIRERRQSSLRKAGVYGVTLIGFVLLCLSFWLPIQLGGQKPMINMLIFMTGIFLAGTINIAYQAIRFYLRYGIMPSLRDSKLHHRLSELITSEDSCHSHESDQILHGREILLGAVLRVGFFVSYASGVDQMRNGFNPAEEIIFRSFLTLSLSIIIAMVWSSMKRYMEFTPMTIFGTGLLLLGLSLNALQLYTIIDNQENFVSANMLVAWSLCLFLQINGLMARIQANHWHIAEAYATVLCGILPFIILGTTYVNDPDTFRVYLLHHGPYWLLCGCAFGVGYLIISLSSQETRTIAYSLVFFGPLVIASILKPESLDQVFDLSILGIGFTGIVLMFKSNNIPDILPASKGTHNRIEEAGHKEDLYSPLMEGSDYNDNFAYERNDYNLSSYESPITP
eukprot:CAMPEP_0115038206 /NCGR_PEP_ID=MMETSP0216-20121206/43270_1 /TAXON_ID=223996 /ORGANISM="Protocruzia adherens, Strain Boccale" /LENGTH=406 /DNA_ID=CAMNT_0002418561 /DNA_START=227 /DNA_END=1447 /DNA_ORIENTATION=+